MNAKQRLIVLKRSVEESKEAKKRASTAESRLFIPPRGTKAGSKNRQIREIEHFLPSEEKNTSSTREIPKIEVWKNGIPLQYLIFRLAAISILIG